ncbi:MAG: GNAT family N-acetyltransferase [Bryobacteraceae bacterium]
MADTVRITALDEQHDRSSFASGSDALDRYFKTQASQDLRRRIATCFVAVSDETDEIVGYYTLAATNIALTDLSPATAKKLPRYPTVPAVLLGRLAIAKSHQGRGLGSVLLVDAIKRCSRAELGIFAIVVDAKDEGAQRFYEHFGFSLLPGAGRRLMLPMNEALRNLG